MEKKIHTLRQIYLRQTISDRVVEEMWDQLSERLPDRNPRRYLPVSRFAFLSLFVTLITFAGIVGIAQATKPDEPLYPVKILSDQIAKKAAGAYQKIMYHALPTSTPEQKHQPVETILPTNTLTPTPEEEGRKNDTSSETEIANSQQEEGRKEQPTPPGQAEKETIEKPTQENGRSEEVRGTNTENHPESPSEQNKLNAENKNNKGEDAKNDAHKTN